MKWTAPEIKRRRGELGLSQDQLATAVGVSRSVVQKWESGERNPRGMSVRGLDEVLGEQPTPPAGLSEAAATLAALSDADRAALLASYSDLAVLADLGRRLAERRGNGAELLPERDLRWDAADRPAARRQDGPDKSDTSTPIDTKQA